MRIFLTLKDPGFLLNEKTRGGGGQFISACSNVKRLIFVYRKILCKAVKVFLTQLPDELSDPQKRPFSSVFFWIWFLIFFLNPHTWLIYKLFFTHIFWFEVFINIKSHVILANFNVFALFWPPPGSQAWHFSTQNLRK